ncbi:Gamma-secretase-activating protein [Tupaia chinensis]|uniref:Gamma-secretase-activating protein n=1 Tax=Tupaia chinensis TaxID=246437 RepID=L9LBN4_TUPCH|nr:Gamma-secretase-activating protein [Tupaia chinensis]
MALRLVTDFELRKDVLPWLRAVPAVAGSGGGGSENNYESLRVLNVERNGNIIYTYKHLYTFEKDLQVVSCSVNSEKTLLGSKCLTLLVEIHPVNNVKVLKAVDSYIWVQKSRSVLKCIQFYPNESFTLMFEAPLDISLSDSGLKLVNFGCDYCQEEEKLSKHLTLCVFTNHTGHRKTFTADLGSTGSHVTKDITFLNLDYYVAVYLPGHFFHLLNIQHPDLICHSLFLTGDNEMINMLPHSPLQSLSGSLVLDWCSGKLYRALLNQSYLLQFLWNTCLDYEKMAVLHCILSCGREVRSLEDQTRGINGGKGMCEGPVQDVPGAVGRQQED